MPFTIAVDEVGADYIIRLTQSDALAESVRKVFELRNLAAGNVQAVMRAYEGLTQAALEDAGASIDVAVTGASLTVGTAGMFPKIGDQMILGFDRPHPIVTNTTLVVRNFIIPAPHPDTYLLTTLKPDPVRGINFAAAASRKEALGALIDYLEDALIYEHDGIKYAGGFTYREARSGLISTTRQYDADDRT
jgi:hypothetical protein